jgi:hypothetical protein
MRFWISDRLPEKVRPPVGEAVDTPEGGLINFLPDYWEYVAVHPAMPGSYFIYYWMPMPDDEYLVATCWGHTFDHVRTYMTEGKFANVWVESIRRDWPIFTDLLDKAANVASPADLRQGGLLSLQGGPGGEEEWYVAASFWDPHLTQIEQMFSGASETAFHKVIRLSFDLGQEYVSSVGTGMARLPPNIITDLGAAEDPVIRRLKQINRAISIVTFAGDNLPKILESGVRLFVR